MKRKLSEAANTLTDRLTPSEDLQGLTGIPLDEDSFAMASKHMSEYMESWLQDKMSPDDLLMVRSSIRGKGESNSEPNKRLEPLLATCDELIFEQAGILGMRIFLSKHVLDRVLRWEGKPNGDLLYKRLGQELALCVRVRRDRAKAPLNPLLRDLYDELKSELKKLKQILVLEFSKPSLPTDQQLLEATMQLVKDPYKEFERLRQNATALEIFIKSNPAFLRDMVLHKVSPVTFAIEILASTTNRSPEALRQAISKMKTTH
jgi:hypothetical protein